MITEINDDTSQEAQPISHVVQHHAAPNAPTTPFLITENTGPPKNQQLLQSKFIQHAPNAGINPLVDAAAYLFSIIGKLKSLASYRHLKKLHQELIDEVNAFQEAIKTQGYSPEYSLVSRYALCATLDDIIINTPWGSHGQWDSYNLLTVFNQDNPPQERFFLILERIIKDPGLYIDLMEFMYICLSLGYKGSYSSTEYSNTQLEKITDALYKRIRIYQGDYSKMLSPLSTKTSDGNRIQKPRTSYTLITLITACTILLLFIGLSYSLDLISNKAYQELTSIGKLILYESHKS